LTGSGVLFSQHNVPRVAKVTEDVYLLLPVGDARKRKPEVVKNVIGTPRNGYLRAPYIPFDLGRSNCLVIFDAPQPGHWTASWSQRPWYTVKRRGGGTIKAPRHVPSQHLGPDETRCYDQPIFILSRLSEWTVW